MQQLGPAQDHGAPQQQGQQQPFDVPDPVLMAPAERLEALEALRRHQRRAIGDAARARTGEPAAEALASPAVDALPLVVTHPREVEHRRQLAGTGSPASAFFWWDNRDYTYTQGGGLCANYGGNLAVLSASTASLPSNLLPGVSARGMNGSRIARLSPRP